MKTSAFIAILALLGLTVEAAKLSQTTLTANRNNDDDEVHFQKFVSKFQRSYRTKGEYNTRLSNFKKNKKIVDDQNSKNEGFQLELNKLSDLSDNEYQSMLGVIIPQDKDDDNKAQFLEQDNDEVEEDLLAEQSLPSSVNWVTAGAVQAVRNQGSCGSCYSFSALGAMESALWIKSKTTVNLPEQQVVDCSGVYGNQGCNGGWMNYVFNYAKATKLTTEDKYPYTAKKGTCKTVSGSYKVTGYVDVTPKSPSAMLTAVAKQPVTIALSAGSSVFQLYRSGILNSSACGTTLNHAVIIVGYGISGSTPYWLVRNSWGSSWGESGYIRIYRSSTTGVGICGLLSKPSYPTV